MIHFEIATDYGKIFIEYLGKKFLPNIQQNDWNSYIRERMHEYMGMHKSRIYSINQVHGDIVINTSEIQNADEPYEADALITDKEEELLVIRTADCVPISIWCYNTALIANIHSGWKGTRSNILEKTFAKMQEIVANKNISNPKFGFAIGPRISGENYEVGMDVARYFQGSLGLHEKNPIIQTDLTNQVDLSIHKDPNKEDKLESQKFTLDLGKEILTRIRRIAGKSFIIDIPETTYDSEEWFSHRYADKGRNLNMITIRK